jgi:hypothetical protein
MAVITPVYGGFGDITLCKKASKEYFYDTIKINFWCHIYIK